MQSLNPDEGKTLEYDDFGRLKKKIGPQGTTDYSYSPLNKTTSSPTGTKEETFNSAGQLINSTVDGKSVEFEYWPSGKMKTATPQDGEAVQYSYDLQGNCEKIIDPDAGVIEKSYNGFGELVREVRDIHTSGNSEVVTTYEYQKGGLIDFVEVNGQKTDYGYDRHNRLETVVIEGQHTREFEYNGYDQIIKQTETIEGEKTYISEKAYDKYGRIKEEIYPTGYSISKTYNKYGVLEGISDSDGNMIWEAVEENPRGRLTEVKKGGKELRYGFDANGFPEYIRSDDIIDRDYSFSREGNLESWTDNLTNQQEDFIYDEQNRLTDWMTYDGDSLLKADYTAYDVNSGNIITKTGINFEMVYGEEDHGPHALTSIKGKPSSFSMNDRDIAYTDFSKVEEITEGEKTLNITYGVNNQRVKMSLDDGDQSLTRYYQPNFEEEIQGEVSRKIHYISARDGIAAIYVQQENEDALYYTYTDHLGSLVAITDDTCNPVERFSYDPWGNRRDPDDWTQKITTPVSEITGRGYTMHEHLNGFDLINMNGRVYDPLTSRFLSPDPYIQAPGQWLNYDRYAYAMNNPLLYTDPTGYKWDWNWLNPVHWMSEGMQWINDNTTGLRQTMVDIGVPDFNVGYSMNANLSGRGVSSTYQSPGGSSITGVNFATGSEFYSQLTPRGALRDLAIFPGLRANYQMHGVSVDMGTGSLMFDDSSMGYDYMWNKSFYNENGRFGPAREVSGFALQSGKTIVMPYHNNTVSQSDNSYLKLQGGYRQVKFNNQWYPVLTHIHTHPQFAPAKDNPIGLSRRDLRLQQKIGRPIFIIYDRAIYSIDGTYNYEKNMWNFEELMIW